MDLTIVLLGFVMENEKEKVEYSTTNEVTDASLADASLADALLNDVLNNPENLTPFAVGLLPEDLKEEVRLNSTDKFEIDVLNLVDRAKNRTMSIDNLLVALKITTGKLYKRTILNLRLYRMVKKGLLLSVSKRKGIYKIKSKIN